MSTLSCFDLFTGDCLAAMYFMEDNSVDSIVTDPPYGLSFMGKAWDHGVPSVAIWREALRVLKPGGHLLAFGGSRMYHRMACAVEDAGFEIRDQIMWVYGSGFPKSLDVGKAIDKAAGAEREVVGEMPDRWTGAGNTLNFSTDRPQSSIPVTGAPATDAAKQWDGWGTALKPAHEPIVVARKPLIGTVAANVLAHGTGGLNIDGCRVGTEDMSGQWDRTRNDNSGEFGERYPQSGREAGKTVPPGRWPANWIHDCSDEVLAAFPQAKGQQGALTGSEPSSKTVNTFGEFAGRASSEPRGDTGSAARFFYCAKASKADRDEGLDGAPDRVLAMSNQAKAELARGNMHAGDSGMNTAKVRKNHHPTVKPTDLMAYLCRLVTPPGGLVFDPFTGSGSTGKAALREGFRFTGAELDPEYAAIARARLEAASYMAIAEARVK